MTATSIPEVKSRIAQECRKVWAVTCFVAIEGQLSAALVVWRVIRRSIASRLSGLPVVVGNNGSDGLPSRSLPSLSGLRETPGSLEFLARARGEAD